MRHLDGTASTRCGSALRLALRAGAAASVFAALAGSAPARAQAPEPPSAYHVAVGDTIEITVATMPDLAFRTTINLDGDLVVPIGDPVPAAGLTLTELRERVRQAMAGRVLQRRTSSEVLPPVTVPPDEIAVAVYEYRPVYLGGDVAKPGMQEYRPGMTVRQAFADAGGYNVLPLQRRPPILEASEIFGKLNSLELERLREQARADELRRELGSGQETGGDAADPAQLAAIAADGVGELPPERQFAAIEAQRTAAERANVSTEIGHLTEIAALLQRQQERLEGQRETVDQAVQVDQQEVERYQELTRRGLSPVSNTTEARRALFLSSSRQLDNTVAIGNLAKEVESVQRDIDDRRQERRIDVLDTLSEVELRLRQLDAEIDAAKEQLVLVNGLRTDLAGPVEDQSEVTIARIVDGTEMRFRAELSTALQPGDVATIELRRIVGSY